MRSWQMQEAKNKLSEVVRCAKADGPQSITVRGEEEAVVISADDYARMCRGEIPPRRGQSLYDYFRDSPLWDSGIVIGGDDEPLSRGVDFSGPEWADFDNEADPEDPT